MANDRLIAITSPGIRSLALTAWELRRAAEREAKKEARKAAKEVRS